MSVDEVEVKVEVKGCARSFIKLQYPPGSVWERTVILDDAYTIPDPTSAAASEVEFLHDMSAERALCDTMLAGGFVCTYCPNG
eukprot:1639315-Pleurochrysis_carterae.AAC.1